MKKTVFYLLPDTTAKARDMYACRLIEKAYTQNRQIYIHINSLTAAQAFDMQLWTFRDLSFIPHEIYNENTPVASPILIGYQDLTPPTSQNDVLVNLAPEIPQFHQQFQHIIELVLNDEALKVQSRQHYKFYQQQGFQVETIKI